MQFVNDPIWGILKFEERYLRWLARFPTLTIADVDSVELLLPFFYSDGWIDCGFGGL